MTLDASTLTTSAAGTTAVQPRLVTAAHDFEAMMLKELLKPMTESATGEEDSEGELGSGSALGEFASEALGRALSQRGGFGIANRIIGGFSSSSNLPSSTE